MTSKNGPNGGQNLVGVCLDNQVTMEDARNTSSSSIEVDDCPPTPEHIAPGSKTPPPSTSQRHRPHKKGSKRRSKSLDGRSSPDSEATCPICLGDIDNKSMTDTCLHKFCFTCLLEWSKVRAVCPLCKGQFSAIIHNIRSDDDYDRYELPPPLQGATGDPGRGDIEGLQDFLFSTRRFRYHSTMTREALESRYRRFQFGLNHDPLRSGEIWRRRRGPGTSEFRRQVYMADLWAQPLTRDGRTRECSPEWYRNNEAQAHRLVPWLNRELNALLSINGQQSRQMHLITQIIDWIKIHAIGSQELSNSLLPYLGTNTDHFQHEFLQFARSPYDITGYDRNVTYDRRRLQTEVVSSDSDSDEAVTVDTLDTDLRHDQGDTFVSEISSRVRELVAQRDLLIRRRGQDGGLGLGVTNYPDREVARTPDYTRGEIRRQPRDDSQRSYRREIERLWGLSPRRETERDREGNNRRKKRKPSKYQRQVGLSFRDEALEDEDTQALDLSVGDNTVEEAEINVEDDQPSTSRGHSSGLTRLVIPDESDDDEDNLIIEESVPSSRTIAEDILSDIVSRIPRTEPHNQPSSSSQTEQELAQFVANQLHYSQLPNINQGYYAGDNGAMAFLNELSGMMHLQQSMMNPGHGTQDDGDNSDLEVVDVVAAKPPRKKSQSQDPEVVELSDSEEENLNTPTAAVNSVVTAADDDVVLIISSDEEEPMEPADNIRTDRMRMTLNPNAKSKNNADSSSSSSSDSSSEDDLIVVKTEHNTIDPITKKQIVDPVRNKKCNHIYEKSTIYSMIDIARENSKPVKCPYMGCNGRDFKKNDLVKDKEVLGHINTMKEEKEKADLEKERKEMEKRKKKKASGYASDNSIIEDIDDDEDTVNKSADISIPGLEAPNLSESSSEETNPFNPNSSQTPLTTSQSASSLSLNTSNSKEESSETVDYEKSKSGSNKEKTSKKSKKKKRTERLSYSEVSDSSDSDSDVPLSRARTKRSRKPSSRLAADSYACSDQSGDGRRGSPRKKGKGKKIKIMGKKVTETWCIEKAASKAKKRKKRRNESESEDDIVENSEESEAEEIPVSSKGKSSRGKPPKNATFSRNRPKRAKQVSYKELEEDY